MAKEKEVSNDFKDAGKNNKPIQSEKEGLFSIALFEGADNSPRVSLSRYNTRSKKYEKIKFFTGELKNIVDLGKKIESSWFER